MDRRARKTATVAVAAVSKKKMIVRTRIRRMMEWRMRPRMTTGMLIRTVEAGKYTSSAPTSLKVAPEEVLNIPNNL